MEDKIKLRLGELFEQGNTVIRDYQLFCHNHKTHQPYYLPIGFTARAQKWIASVSNIMNHISKLSELYKIECEKILSQRNFEKGIPQHAIYQLWGLLESAKEELDKGLLGNYEFIIFAETFDDFLDKARFYHKGKDEKISSILVSVVLEDVMKKIGNKNKIDVEGNGVEEIVTKLKDKGIITEVTAKEIRFYAGIRKHALHAEWDKLDIKDIGKMINGVHDLLKKYLLEV